MAFEELSEKRSVIIVAGIVVAVGIVTFATVPALGDNGAVALEGGDSQANATTIGDGQEIEILLAGDQDNNWYRIPIENDGTAVTLQLSGDNDWDNYDHDGITLGSESIGKYETEGGDEFHYVATESYVYVNFDSDYENIDGHRFTVTTNNPEQGVFEIQNVTVFPNTDLRPSESMTVQADIYYDRESVLNPETVEATLTIGSQEVATETATGQPNGTISMQFTEAVPTDLETGQHNLVVHVAPDWAERGGNEQSVAVTIEEQDIDGDGLQRDRELELGTDPNNPDTDGDGINDGRELEIETNATKPDTDDDGLEDGPELEHGADPLIVDTDDDGLDDGEEVNEHGTDPASEDTDGDGIEDARELELGTDPTDSDTDDDGLDDQEEIQAGSDPTDAGDREGERGPIEIAGPESTAAVDGTVTVEYTISVSERGRTLNGTSLALSGVDGWSVVDHSGDGTFREPEMQWLFLSITGTEERVVSVTLEPSESAGDTETIEAIASDADGNRATTTTTVNLDTVPVDRAIDQNGNGELELIEVQRAIRLWSNDEPVPNTGGETLETETIQRLISVWSNDESI